MKLISAIKIFVAILFLISPIDILCEKIPKYTLQNQKQRKLDYIRVEYGKEATYKAKEFKNQHRQSIDYITYKGHIVDLEKEFTIEANTIIEIYFYKPITTLEDFFSGYDDDNFKFIKLIDLSHFNSSSVESTNSMFAGCSSLGEINFDNFDTSKVTNMSYMFEGCSNLKSLDLSNFNTSQVTLMVNMFYKCSSLEYLDISNFNTLNVGEYPTDEMFLFVYSLKYLNLYNIQIDENNKYEFKIRIKGIIQNSTIVCQKDDFEIDSKITYIKRCCDFNLETSSCDPDNYIKVKYKKEVTYPYGFSINEHDKPENQYRKDIYLINKKSKRYKPNENLTIEENTEIKIVFNSTIKSLAKFFYVYYDPNVEYISSIDFTYFDSSSLESLESTFYGCDSLESIDLSTFTAPSLTNMGQTFFHCTSLKSLNLSKLTSKSITNTNGIFYGCESLFYINMINLDLSKVNNATYMFYNMKGIKYLDINSTKFNDKINDEFKRENGLNNKDYIVVCKNEENFPLVKYISICCDNFIELKCNNYNNYIICKYKETVEYKDGFQIGFREIAFIKNETTIVFPNEKLIIEANTTIEIYFSEPITTLDGFFPGIGDIYDSNSQLIKLIDFSHFNSSSLESTIYMFFQCYSLEEINFNNFDTSKVTSMSNMFSRCTNIKSLDLSKFDTSNVNMIDSMFDGCTSLEYLDISNFNTLNVIREYYYTETMFFAVNSLKYINLYNARIIYEIKTQIEKIVKDTTIVCQKDQIINKGIQDCSIFNQSDNYTNDNEVPLLTSGDSSTFPEIKNGETNVVLLGFSQFRPIEGGSFAFYIYFTATKNILTTKHILFPMEITYNRNIRRLLKEIKANCTHPVESDKKYKYYCLVDEKPDNIKEAKLIPDFDFVSQDNVTLTGTTPLAKMFMNNMMAMKNQDKYDNILENSLVYILDNSNFYKYDQLLFNITGEINDPQPKIDNKNLSLMINLENNDTIQIPCIISNITKNKYILNCKSNESFKGEIQSAVSFIDNNDILLLNFADIKESNIDIETTPNNRKFFTKKENKLGAGAIVGIVISIIVVIALIAFIIFHLRKNNKKDANDTNSSTNEFKASDGIKH